MRAEASPAARRGAFIAVALFRIQLGFFGRRDALLAGAVAGTAVIALGHVTACPLGGVAPGVILAASFVVMAVRHRPLVVLGGVPPLRSDARRGERVP
ncbi:hypothetical protein I2W78_38930 [Streptomyces spinoverrucosus]|uniref:hypothetical protein n=1 Tax=Streptomyces spinoverrucosus TaxID=284043 RepID=UPI0018C35EDD|nr:hypothetical protein [Streptomyces spinoverrucosus]MBG0857668.1 hypothetical protein [Streptomyces spinoverrucosus]